MPGVTFYLSWLHIIWLESMAKNKQTIQFLCCLVNFQDSGDITWPLGRVTQTNLCNKIDI